VNAPGVVPYSVLNMFGNPRCMEFNLELWQHLRNPSKKWQQILNVV